MRLGLVAEGDGGLLGLALDDLVRGVPPTISNSVRNLF